ncbi:MAG: hypothetical protein NTV51_19195 [Verrucomicrobia bacterium]|nr:hypothetical protein [Verrucomicrobiota bacterium]
MKSRLLWVFAAVAVLSAAALFVARKQLSPGRRHPDVAIQDGKTIDFSSGQPVVKDSDKEKADIARAVKEMEEAAKDVSFSPPPPKAPETKKAEAKK